MFAGLVIRSWIEAVLVRQGHPVTFAADLSYLLVLPLLGAFLAPVLWSDRAWLRGRLRQPGTRVLLAALGTGLLLRLAWWAQLAAGVSFGLYASPAVAGPADPELHLACPPAGQLVLGLFVMTVVIPIVEEIVNRGYVQTYLARYGSGVAIAGSAAVFTVLHVPAQWPFVFLIGTVFGLQYRITGRLWPPIICHAAYNALVIADWRCLRGRWHPSPEDLPLWLPGIAGVVLLAGCVGAIGLLLALHRGRGDDSPRPAAPTALPRRVR